MSAPTPPPLDPALAVRGPPSLHVMAKPSGSTCNIDCKYCFFLSKQALYPDGRQRMSDRTLEAYIRQLLESQRVPEVTIAWQGGEPTLMGVDFYRKAFELAERCRRPGQKITHAFQTNGIALDDRWCEILKAHGVLVGLSVDGPQELHDAYRVTRAGKGTFDLVMAGWNLLVKHGVDCNVLCTVNRANEAHGRRVYEFFRDGLGARFIQFIPIVERATKSTITLANRGWTRGPGEKRLLYTQSGDCVTDRSVTPKGYGRFLIEVFDEWLRRDVGQVFVQTFDVALEAHFGIYQLCVHAPTCGGALALEHNGDLYSCDHYVEPKYRLGNIHERHMRELASTPPQVRFGQKKRDALTRQCLACDVLPLCNGGCPKDRFAISRDGQAGQDYLCEGLYDFFAHSRPAMAAMADLLRRGRAPAEIMDAALGQDARNVVRG